MTYAPQIFEGLHEFRVARQLLDQHRKHLPTLGDVICQHELHQIVGISLLHKHFDLDADERLVEKFTGKSFCIKPEVIDEQEGLTPYLWKAEHDPEVESWQYHPLEFVESIQDTEAVQKNQKTLLNHPEFLVDMSQKLSTLGLANVFGIALLHRDCLSLNLGEILVETTDEKNRTLACSPVLANESLSEGLTQTLWSFSPQGDTEVLGQCIMHCNSHCYGHE
jgi:hypothetical protein